MGSLGTIFTIILVVAWVVRSLASATGNDGESKQRKGRSVEEWDEMQSQRRTKMSDQQEALSDMRAETSAQNPAQMTMAQRIELARQRARQQAGLSGQDDAQAETLQRARLQAERQAQQQRQRAAQQEHAKVQRRRQAQQQAQEQAEQQAQRQHRSKQQRRSQPKPARATTGSKREGAVNKSMPRVHKGHSHSSAPTVAKTTASSKTTGRATGLGTLSRSNLRKAFIMKELLDKPVALRDPQSELHS